MIDVLVCFAIGAQPMTTAADNRRLIHNDRNRFVEMQCHQSTLITIDRIQTTRVIKLQKVQQTTLEFVSYQQITTHLFFELPIRHYLYVQHHLIENNRQRFKNSSTKKIFFVFSTTTAQHKQKIIIYIQVEHDVLREFYVKIFQNDVFLRWQKESFATLPNRGKERYEAMHQHTKPIVNKTKQY
jgi:hypothetical protein